MTPSVIRIGLVGLGHVGSAFATALLARADQLQRAVGARLAITQIAVRHADRWRPAHAAGILHDAGARVADDPSIDIFVEASGAPQASSWKRAALERGAWVVTANKQSIARDHVLLAALAAGERRLLCEATVAAAVPVVRALRDSLAGEEVYSIRGVLNGTTTFVLSRLERGIPFGRAVLDAQRAGYAEADPTSDLGGLDAAAKIAILATIAWRTPFPIESVRTSGITEEMAADVVAAADLGQHVRLVASANRDDATNSIRADVRPHALERDDALAGATGVHNVVEVRAALAGTLTWSGPGAGGVHTASALLGDVVVAAREIARLRLGRAAA